MSPLDICDISCANTASASSLFILLSKPVETATRELFLVMPVANAFTSAESNTATSGILIPTIPACIRTVFISQTSVGVVGSFITTAPDIRLADHLDIANEINAPPKPKIAAKASKLLKSSPFSFKYGSTPRMRMVTDSTSIMAMLVAKK
jgi:hypothetical protein